MPLAPQSLRKGGCHIKTLPGWLIGALVALATFVAAAFAFTHWIERTSERVRTSYGGGPRCEGDDCAPERSPPPEFDAGIGPRVASIDASIDRRRTRTPVEEEDAEVDVGVDVAAPIVEAAVEIVVEAAPPPPEKPAPAQCGARTCPEGQVCCNSSCGLCTLPGGTCTQELCGVPQSPLSWPCGPNTCNITEICCNASCGICTPPGGTCSHERCDILQLPFSTPCGRNTCNTGQICCNPSCGTCTAPGEPCNWEPCPQ
ncbi:MAG TPA: hypothetical protein VJT73_08265 [Polyangiaceae bacterium]|nr:hypothetical protein [Polyangiaceae bacterium]